MAENYKHLYEQMKKMVAMYQDEIVPGMRKQLENRVEVVRCKDCKYGTIDNADFADQYLCKHNGCDWNNGDHFCSYGERRNDG